MTETKIKLRGIGLDDDAIQRVEKEIERIETLTQAEIVPMVVRGSITTGHVFWLCFVLLLLIFWSLVPLWLDRVDSLEFWMAELLAALVAGGLALVLSRFAAVQRFLTPASDEQFSVDRRALLEFHLSRIMSTEHRTGVLIMVSLLERRAVILADRRISAELSDSTWQEPIETLLSHLRRGDLAGGFCEAIRAMEKPLVEKFPRAGVARNELSNEVVIKD